MDAHDRPPTRDRLVEATVALMRTKGPAASGTKEILERADAPRGSFYFHFPQGKDQLVLEALDRAADTTLQMLRRELADDSGDLAEQVRAVFTAVERELVETDYAQGCAVAATTAETVAVAGGFRAAVAAAFAGWTEELSVHLVRRGLPPSTAAALADLVVAAMEGAAMLARARRDPSALRSAADLLATTVDAALAHHPHQHAHQED